MAKMNSKFKYMFDAAPSVRLIARDGVAKDTSFNSGVVVLDKLEGHWTSNELADQTFAVAVNVTDLEISPNTGTFTLNTVIATDSVTLDDGVNSPVTLVADTDFDVGADDDETAANLAAAINDLFDAGDLNLTASAAAEVVTVTNVDNNAGAALSDADTTITTVDFAGGDETYSFAVQVGPVGFGSNAVLGTLNISRPGQYVFLVDLDTAKAIKSDTAAIRLVGTLAGTAPSITLYSWIAGRILQ